MAPRRKRQKLTAAGDEVATTSPPSPTVLSHNKPARAAPQGTPSRRQLFVRSLAASTTTDDLTAHFSASFPIKHAVAVTDPSTGQCKGYGFVTFGEAEDAERARELLDGSMLGGRRIRCEGAVMRRRGDGDEDGADGAQRKSVAAEKTPEQQPPPKLIVRNLPWSVDSAEKLARLFLSYGKVREAVVPKTKEGKMRGFGIVLIRGRKNAERAVLGVNGKVVDGRTLAVDWAVDKETWRHAKEEGIAEQDGQHEEKGANGLQNGEEGVEDEQGGDDGSSDDDAMWEDEEPADKEEEYVGLETPVAKPDSSTPDFTDSTLFVRNLPFNCTDEDLEDHFSQFGPIRYSRVVFDASTGLSRGTGFVCFRKKPDAGSCLKEAPKSRSAARADSERNPADRMPQSVLENESLDPSGRYTMAGRVLQVTQAVDKAEASRLASDGVAKRRAQDKDKRRLYLLHEGSIASNSPLYQLLSASEIAMREASAKQRKSLVESNPSLHLSLTRLAIRNIPRSITSKDLKALAREAVVGFAKDVKEGLRQPLSKEELARGGEDMREAERQRKAKGKGIVKQVKIVFEGREGQKVDEATGAGRSRGYGFVEYYTHRNALMGLRWLNGHAVGSGVQDKASGKKDSKADVLERRRRLIVEFALENAQVVKRRMDKEVKQRGRANKQQPESDGIAVEQSAKGANAPPEPTTMTHKEQSKTRKSREKTKKLNDRRQRKIQKRQARLAEKSGKAVPL